MLQYGRGHGVLYMREHPGYLYLDTSDVSGSNSRAFDVFPWRWASISNICCAASTFSVACATAVPLPAVNPRVEESFVEVVEEQTEALQTIQNPGVFINLHRRDPLR